MPAIGSLQEKIGFAIKVEYSLANTGFFFQIYLTILKADGMICLPLWKSRVEQMNGYGG
jgi:hypothetical protein